MLIGVAALYYLLAGKIFECCVRRGVRDALRFRSTLRTSADTTKSSGRGFRVGL